MTQIVKEPPRSVPDEDGSVDGGWWHDGEVAGRIVCDLCPRECNMKPGDRGFCFVRQNVDGRMKLTTYGKSTGFCIDPIEKKPLNHFHPGTSVLSFGTAGCNLGCQFCQNWDISKSREVERLSELAMPDMIAAAAKDMGCRSVAYTYNDPIIWAEYAIDTAKACRQLGIKSVAVTAGYISPEARPALFHAMDAANVDLKAFTEDFYQKITYSHIKPVLETLKWLKHESDVWFEITNLVIPDLNDSPDELQQMCDWILDSVGPNVPLHFSAFHPDFRMNNRANTPHETLLRAHEIAKKTGLNFVYVGNVNDVANQSTYCPKCKALLIERNWYQLGQYNMQGERCGSCGTHIPGHFDDKPGNWGSRRLPVRISDYAARENRPGEIRVPVASLSTPVDSVAAPATPAHIHAAQSPKQQSAPATSASNSRQMISTQSAMKTTVQTVREQPALTSEQESAIHHVACKLVLAAVQKESLRITHEAFQLTEDRAVMGAFVTLKRTGQLRGCCGTLGQPMSIVHAITQSALRTATDDHRFPPVSLSELPHLTLDVTLLSNFETIAGDGDARVAAVEIGRHGLRIEHNGRAGLLLPSVATEHGWNAREFLDHVCRKAGLPTTAWQQPDAHLQRFEGKMIEGEFDRSLLSLENNEAAFPYYQEEVAGMARFARSNVLALFEGAVPGCFPANISDGTVDGIALQLRGAATATSEMSVTFSRIQLRGGLPLQSTLLQLTQTAADWLRTRNVDPQFCRTLAIDLALFTDPALHGTIKSPELAGLNPATRAVIVTEALRTAWCFNPKLSADDLLHQTSRAAQISEPATALIRSLAVRCSAAQMSESNVPQPQTVQQTRPPGVAGKFYPAEAEPLSRMVDECIGEIPLTRERWPAVMVPHAGLIYSGRIAAGVLKQIEIPETVIIIGPKHTPYGVEWAIAPNDVWQLPGTTLRSDMQLARLLAERIDGLQLDVAAHAREHCIEVELPLLARLAPQTKVIGIAIGGGSLDRCRRFGQQLADVISELPSPPLLLISSDMNHFATDAENRQLDEMAILAMETLDASKLLETVRLKNISMCGVLPAVIVMETLKCLNQLTHTQRAGYATSAEVSGDKTRVVGYAGMLLG